MGHSVSSLALRVGIILSFLPPPYDHILANVAAMFAIRFSRCFERTVPEDKVREVIAGSELRPVRRVTKRFVPSVVFVLGHRQLEPCSN